MDVLLGIGHLEEQQLGDDDVGDHVVHRRAEEDDAVHQQAGIDVVAAFSRGRSARPRTGRGILPRSTLSWRGNLVAGGGRQGTRSVIVTPFAYLHSTRYRDAASYPPGIMSTSDLPSNSTGPDRSDALPHWAISL
jgi:hypothetical protein